MLSRDKIDTLPSRLYDDTSRIIVEWEGHENKKGSARHQTSPRIGGKKRSHKAHFVLYSPHQLVRIYRLVLSIYHLCWSQASDITSLRYYFSMHGNNTNLYNAGSNPNDRKTLKMATRWEGWISESQILYEIHAADVFDRTCRNAWWIVLSTLQNQHELSIDRGEYNIKGMVRYNKSFASFNVTLNAIP